ncbi:MAG: trigger factor [Omnitrophica bacterium RIFCSPHIGHO2_02_FULL_51_18]|nr:MAG: trigger factor [Omnitrophica bacterium RIFCSPHIGHO2_02_FULL_51_18]
MNPALPKDILSDARKGGVKSHMKKLKDCKICMSVEVEAKLVENRFQEVLRDIQRAATLPGFRQGKAPMELVEKQYTNEVYEEVLKSLVPEAYHQSVTTHKVSPVSLPSISNIKMTRGSALSFAAEFENAPEFNLRNYKGLKILRAPVQVASEDVEKGLASLLEARAEFVPVLESRAVREGDILLTDIEVWKGGQYLEGRKGAALSVKPNATDDFFDKVVGAEAGHSVEVSMEPTEEEKRQGVVGKKPMYRITVREIQEKRLPVLDDELAKGFGKESAEALKEAIRTDVAGYKQSESYESMKEQLFEKLLSRVSFELPRGLVQKQKEKLVEQSRRQLEKFGVPSDQREILEKKLQDAADVKAARQVRLYFILQKVAELEDIHADESDLENRLRALVEESGRPLEEVRSVFEEDVRESMKEKKTVEFLLANAKLEETT